MGETASVKKQTKEIKPKKQNFKNNTKVMT